IDGKFTWAGGLRYTPVDIDKSMENGQTELDEENPFSKQFEDYIRPDINIAFRLDGKKISHELSFDIQNFINRKNPYMMTFNTETGEEEIIYQLDIYPMVQYRIVF
ncbi:MAG: hypothetical protein K8R31_04780, partial [Bacteroidales bacterium]|nr:hypothetical protein [Bacteroidales bacterium]